MVGEIANFPIGVLVRTRCGCVLEVWRKYTSTIGSPLDLTFNASELGDIEVWCKRTLDCERRITYCEVFRFRHHVRFRVPLNLVVESDDFAELLTNRFQDEGR